MSKFDNIIFYNLFHNGDVHVSRTFVDKIAKHLKIPCEYHHDNKHLLVDDITAKVCRKRHQKYIKVPAKLVGRTLYLNTWYACYKKIFKNNGVSYKSLYLTFSEHLKTHIGSDINKIGKTFDFIPDINWEKYKVTGTGAIDNFKGKRVFFANNKVNSCQTHKAVEMSKVLEKLAKIHKDKLFIASNKLSLSAPNIVYAGDIIGREMGNLNENAYLSTKCHFIVGCSSGPYTFAMNRTNFMKPKKFIAIVNVNCLIDWAGHNFKQKHNFPAQFVGHNSKNTDVAVSFINRHLQ